MSEETEFDRDLERYGNVNARNPLSSRSSRSIHDEVFDAALPGGDPSSEANCDSDVTRLGCARRREQ